MTDEEFRKKAIKLRGHLRKAASLAKELEEHLPLAAPGRGYIDWYHPM